MPTRRSTPELTVTTWASCRRERHAGPAPAAIEPWVAMDYGPSLMATVEAGDDGANIAYKGIAVRLDPGPGGVSRGRAWALFEHDTLRLAAAWTGEGFIDWEGINFNGKHQVHPRSRRRSAACKSVGPRLGRPGDRQLRRPASPRAGRPPVRPSAAPLGPLSRPLSQWQPSRPLVHDRHNGRSRIAGARRLRAAMPIVTRAFELGPATRELVLQVAHLPGARPTSASCPSRATQASRSCSAQSRSTALDRGGPFVGVDGIRVGCLLGREFAAEVPKGADTLRFTLRMATAEKGPNLLEEGHGQSLERRRHRISPRSLTEVRRAGRKSSRRRAKFGRDNGPFAVDVLTHPESNPWLCQMRLTGLDFLPGGKQAVLCTWDGDVWQVDGIDRQVRDSDVAADRIRAVSTAGHQGGRRSDLRLLPRPDRDPARLERRR